MSEENISIDKKSILRYLRAITGWDLLIFIFMLAMLITAVILWQKEVAACNSYWVDRMKDCIMIVDPISYTP